VSRSGLCTRIGILTAAVALTLGTASAPAVASGTAASRPAGPFGSAIVLANGVTLRDGNVDVGADKAGNSYIAWIAPRRNTTKWRLYMCALLITTSKCADGVQSVDALGDSTGMRVLVTPRGKVKIVWFHDTAKSINRAQKAKIAEATVGRGHKLSAAKDVASAPSFGRLLDAQLAPSGKIWTVAYAGLPSRVLQVRAGLGSKFAAVHTPFGLGYASLAVSKRTVMLTASDGTTIGQPAAYATRSVAGKWSRYHNVRKTWTVAHNTPVVATRHGLRLIAATNNATYRPVIAKWLGRGFSTPRLTADNNACAPSFHDASTDASGRLLDVSLECNKVTITSYPDAAHAAILRFGIKGVPTIAPQIAAGQRGIATVEWSAESKRGGSILRAQHLALPDVATSKTAHSRGGRVFVLGPRSCLPPVDANVAMYAHPTKGWRVATRSFRFGTRKLTTSRKGTRIDGARLRSGKTYALTASAVFRKGGQRSTARVTLKFTSC
jgi:hypothetical protein